MTEVSSSLLAWNKSDRGALTSECRSLRFHARPTDRYSPYSAGARLGRRRVGWSGCPDPDRDCVDRLERDEGTRRALCLGPNWSGGLDRAAASTSFVLDPASVGRRP